MLGCALQSTHMICKSFCFWPKRHTCHSISLCLSLGLGGVQGERLRDSGGLQHATGSRHGASCTPATCHGSTASRSIAHGGILASIPEHKHRVKSAISNKYLHGDLHVQERVPSGACHAHLATHQLHHVGVDLAGGSSHVWWGRGCIQLLQVWRPGRLSCHWLPAWTHQD